MFENKTNCNAFTLHNRIELRSMIYNYGKRKKCEDRMQNMLEGFGLNLRMFHDYAASNKSQMRLKICYYTNFINNGLLKLERIKMHLKNDLKIQRYEII